MTDKEKIVYDILCSEEQPPEGQHWEGFVASKIAAALAQPKKEWVGLTDEEKKAIYEQADAENWHDQPLLEAVEAKLKDKNHG